MKTITMLALGVMLFGTSTVVSAAAKKHHSSAAPTHHCQLNGTESHKSKSDCTKAGGTWEKGAPSAKTGDTTAPAESGK